MVSRGEISEVIIIQAHREQSIRRESRLATGRGCVFSLLDLFFPPLPLPLSQVFAIA